MKSIRVEFEKREQSFISKHGCLSIESRGRLKFEKDCPIRTPFQRDRDRIVYSTAFRRLKYKTQVFLSPMGDEYRTRLTHTLEVSEIARTITRAMRLNEDLAEAISLGHDLGHTPFGHSGETTLKEIYDDSFSHNEQSLRVVDVLENNGQGLNLTYEVRDGILKHSKGFGKIIPDSDSQKAITAEGQIVRVSDVIAYLNHDLDDAIRSGVINENQIPADCLKILGRSHSERAAVMIQDLILSSDVLGETFTLAFSEDVLYAMTSLRQFLYQNVYRASSVHNEFVKAKKILTELFQYFIDNPKELEIQMNKRGFKYLSGHDDHKLRVCDFIASITDRYALHLYTKIFFPVPQV